MAVWDVTLAEVARLGDWVYGSVWIESILPDTQTQHYQRRKELSVSVDSLGQIRCVWLSTIGNFLLSPLI